MGLICSWLYKEPEEPKIPSKSITFESKLNVDFGILHALEQDESFALPTVALVHKGSCFRITPTIYPRGSTAINGTKYDGCLFGVYIDDPIKSLRDGRLDFVIRVMTTNGEVEKIGYGVIISQYCEKKLPNVLYPHFSFGESLDEVKERGFLLPDGKMSITIEFRATEEFFCLETLLDKTPSIGVSQMLYNDLTNNSEAGRKSLVDFAIVSEDGKRFPCHRNVLAMSSEYFQKIVFGKEETIPPDAVEKKLTELGEEGKATLAMHVTTTEVTLQKTETTLPFSGEIVEEILHWLYCGSQSANFLESDVEKIVAAADFLLLPEISQACEKSLVMTTTAANALERIQTAKRLGMKMLKIRAMVMAIEDPNVLDKAEATGISCLKELSSFMQETLRAPKTS